MNEIQNATRSGELNNGVAKANGNECGNEPEAGANATSSPVGPNNGENAEHSKKGRGGTRKKRVNEPPVKPIIKVTLSPTRGGELRKMLNGHYSDCDEKLSPTDFFELVIKNFAEPILKKRAALRNQVDEEFAKMFEQVGGDVRPSQKDACEDR